MEPIKVLIVDDHPLFRQGLAGILVEQEGIELVGEAGHGEEAVERVKELMPDLVLMDIYMPGCDGLEATRRIKKEFPYIKIIILTVAEEDRLLFEAIKSGAQGYLLKNIEPTELINMLRGVFKGDAPISRHTAAKILSEFGRQIRKERELASPLTSREREVLELVAKGLTNKKIGNTLFISEHTVKNHLRNILEKLHLANRAQAVAYALEKGLIGKAGPA
ncbi:MAG: response regulator transcription factor [Thermodesulfobacteriota bacterium]